MNERHDEIDDAVAVEGRLYLLTAEEGSTTQERLGSPGADRGPLIRRVGGTESGAALASRRARYGPDSSSRLNCRIAARQISGEASLITTAILEILSEFLRAIMHGHVALREYAIHFPARKIGELCGLAQTENALRIKRNGKCRSQPLDLFQSGRRSASATSPGISRVKDFDIVITVAGDRTRCKPCPEQRRGVECLPGRVLLEQWSSCTKLK
jgi:hypothetical protein